MRWFINLSIFKKIIIVSLIMMVSAVLWGALNSYLGYLLAVDYTMKKNKALVESMVSTMDGLENDVQKSILSKEEAQDTFKQTIRSARYEGDQYFFVTSLDGQAIVHPLRPEFEKEDLKITSPASHNRYLEFAKVAKANKEGGEMYYEWSKPGKPKEEMYPKSSYLKLMPEWGWVVGTGVYIDDLERDALMNFYLEMSFVFIFALTLAIGTYGAYALLSKPLFTLSAKMTSLADGQLDVDVPYRNRKDEVGMIAAAFSIFKDNAIAKAKLEADQEALKIKAEKEKREIMENLASDFEQKVLGAIDNLTASASEMNQASISLTRASDENSHTSQLVANAALEADGNVQTVAAATEELTASSSEIARQISNVAQKSNRASGQAQQTNEAVKRLNDMANSIGEVVSAIKEIADQTNLLALNATIEAARAGEAGKGFAVVADEVKKLATETAEKTTQIDERVLNIQEAIRASATSMEQIIRDVQDIDHATSSVAGAVEEQNAATAEIGRNVAEASVGTQRVTENIVEVQKNTENTGHEARKVAEASQEIADQTKSLQNVVGEFLKSLRT
ncbi:MAG: methyl-accepting chemotaxis protein [Pseudobdellovibrionaceae bacterium]|jgi:methyl-accepting chemotaxis protein|nr:methyl-accepting chemotaxis protein [Pseudobdellovibrionaceae bacterium]